MAYEARQQSSKDIPMSSSSASSEYSSSPQTPSSSAEPSSKAKQKQKVVHEHRPSLLSMLLLVPRSPDIACCVAITNMRHAGSAISQSEATTINIGDPDGPPRLVSIFRVVLSHHDQYLQTEATRWTDCCLPFASRFRIFPRARASHGTPRFSCLHTSTSTMFHWRTVANP